MKRSRLVVGMTVTLGLGACGTPAATGLAPKTPGAETEQQATCRAAKDPMNPLVVEWPGTAKTAMQAASQRGLVVVSYQGCVMKVLAGCDAGGRYQMKRVAPSQEHLVIDNEDKLYAELPLGVAKLKGYLEEGSHLSLEYVSVGQQVADGPPSALQGNCEGATHYVRAMTMGAYSLDASAARAVGASASAVVTAGGEARGATRHLRGSGDLAACKAQPDGVSCEAVLMLSVELLPTQTATKAEGGFGRGLGGLATLPNMTQMRELVVGQDLANADPALLKLVQTATRLEKDEKVNGEEKRKTWAAVASYSANHPFKAPAQKRAEEWNRVGVAEAGRARKAQQVCDRNVKDSVKLKDLLAIDDEVVPKAQKDAYQREFDRAYSPFGEVLKDCDGWRTRASEAWVGAVLDRQVRADAEEAARADEVRTVAARSEREQQEKDVVSQRDSVRTWKSVGKIGGGVVFGVGTVMLVVGAFKSKSAGEKCAGVECSPYIKDSFDSANLIGNIGLAAMGVGVVTYLGAMVWPVPKSRGGEGAMRIGPGPGTAGMSTTWTF
jgi:hypothetical protein